MNRSILIFGACLLLPVGGCQSTSHPPSGLAAVRITARAEPKQGVRPPSREVAVYDKPAANAQYRGGAFEPVDYASLDNIVVWVEPLGAEATTAPLGAPPGPPMRVEVGGSPGASDRIRAVGVGQTLLFVNRALRPMTLYSVCDGNDFDLGRVAPNGEQGYVVRSPGLIEVLTDSSDQPVARVYAAPTSHVAVTHSGGEVTFTDLAPGRYRVVSWHPRLPGSESTVQLAPDQVGLATITVGVNALPKEYPK